MDLRVKESQVPKIQLLGSCTGPKSQGAQGHRGIGAEGPWAKGPRDQGEKGSRGLGAWGPGDLRAQGSRA
jgi:hypothetical protein